MLADLYKYWAYDLVVCWAIYSVVSLLLSSHLTPDAKNSLVLWLWGDYGTTWLSKFCELFDAVYGKKHLSWRCFFASALTSMIAVFLFYVLLAYVLELLQPKRIGADLPISKVATIPIRVRY